MARPLGGANLVSAKKGAAGVHIDAPRTYRRPYCTPHRRPMNGKDPRLPPHVAKPGHPVRRTNVRTLAPCVLITIRVHRTLGPLCRSRTHAGLARMRPYAADGPMFELASATLVLAVSKRSKDRSRVLRVRVVSGEIEIRRFELKVLNFLGGISCLSSFPLPNIPHPVH